MTGGDVAVVIPGYNAAATVADVVVGVQQALPGATILVVDDGSSDDTASRALAAGAAVASHDVNRGKGCALATGLAAATALAGVRFVVTIDADGQHPPALIPRLLEPLYGHSADLVIGSRRRDAGTMPSQRRLSNGLSSWLVSRATGQKIHDSQSGFRAMTASLAASVRCPGSRYEFETEYLIAAAAAGARIASVWIPTLYNAERSYFRGVSDTLRIARIFLSEWRAVLRGPEKRGPVVQSSGPAQQGPRPLAPGP